MVDEAIKSFRALLYTSLLILFLWLLFWPSAKEKVELYRAAVDLHAWLYLKEGMRLLPVEDKLNSDPSQTISTYKGFYCFLSSVFCPWPRA